MDSIDENIYVSSTVAGATPAPASVATTNPSLANVGSSLRDSVNAGLSSINSGLASAETRIQGEVHNMEAKASTGVHGLADSLRSHLPSHSSSSSSNTVPMGLGGLDSSSTITTTTTSTSSIPVSSYPAQPNRASEKADEYALPSTTGTAHSGGLLSGLKDQLTHLKDSITHHSSTPIVDNSSLGVASDSTSIRGASTSTPVTTTGPSASGGRLNAPSTGGVSGLGPGVKHEYNKDRMTSDEREKADAMDKFPTKADREGDIESFKKHVHSAEERASGNYTSDARRFDKNA